MISYGNKKRKGSAYLNGKYVKLKKGYVYESGQFKKIYSAGNIVTYYVDTGVSYQEEVDSGASCLKPTSFTPKKSDWTFVGWRADKTASGSVLSSKVMGDDPITLYAVFAQTVTRKFVSYDSTQTVTGDKYYNNGNTAKATIIVPTGEEYDGWTWRGWGGINSKAADANVLSENGSTIYTNDSGTVYGLYQQTITLSYNGNGSTGGSTAKQTGTRYHNSAGNYKNPSFTLKTNGFTKTNYAFQKWAQGSAGGTQYASGASVTLSANTTFYAVWQLVPLTLFDNGTLRSGDSFHPYSTWDNADNDDTALREASCGNTLYAYGRTSNYDRYSIAGGIFAQAIDLSGFTKLRVTLNSASIVSSNNSRWFAGLRNNWFSGGNNAGIPYLDNCVLLSEATSGTFDVDLTAYKNAYGNTAYFLFGAGKVNGNSPNGGAWVHITKVWFE